MPLLLLWRHAKALPAESGMADHDRPLARKGHKAARRITDEILHPNRIPDLILCSPSRRTRETFEPVEAKFSGTSLILAEIYKQIDDDYLSIIQTFGGEAERLMLIGHNPAMHATALALTGNRSAGSPLSQGFPTGALAVIECPGAWTDLRRGTARLVEFIRPRDLDKQEASAAS